MRTLTTAAVAAVAAVSVIPTLADRQLKVNFDYLYATESTLEYVVSFEEWQEDNEISILVATPNGYTVNEQPADAAVVAGSVEGLKEGVKYEILIKNGDVTVTSRLVTMGTAVRTQLIRIEHEYQCAVDGTFHFTLVFVDGNGYWSGFEAALTDEYGNSSKCDFSDSPKEEHTLAVNDAGMRGNRATLRITCLSTEPDENGDRTPKTVVLYESEVSI